MSILSDAKWARMNADARSGGAELQYADGQSARLLSLPGRPASVSKGHDHAPAPSSEASTVELSARKPKGRVGERSPHRDEVGKTQTEVEPTHCSFSGPIELDALRLVQSTIQEVQCPSCGSVRKAKVKGQSVVITPHQPLTKRAVRNVPRWMQQGVEWVLVQKKEL